MSRSTYLCGLGKTYRWELACQSETLETISPCHLFKISTSWSRGAEDQILVLGYLGNSICPFLSGHNRFPVNFKPITEFNRDFNILVIQSRRLVKISLVVWNKERSRVDEYMCLIFLTKKLPMWRLLFLLCILNTDISYIIKWHLFPWHCSIFKL